MGYVEMWVEAYASVLLIIMFIEDILQMRKGLLKHPIFLNLQFSAIVMVISDATHHYLFHDKPTGTVGFTFSDSLEDNFPPLIVIFSEL